MALKHKINKAAYDALSEELKNEYIAGDGDNEFVLDVSGLPTPEDTGPLKRALENEKAKYKTLKAERDGLKTQIDEFPDIEALKATHEKEVGKYKTFTEKTLIDGTALTLATSVSSAPKLLANNIRDRFVVDLSGDEPVVKVKNGEGKIDDSFTLEKFKSEVIANPDFKAIIVGSKATGGGAPRTETKHLGGSAPKVGEPGETPDLSKMRGADLAQRIRERKAAQAEAQQ